MDEIEEESIERYRNELTVLYGEYDSLDQIKKGHPTIIPLVSRIREENRKSVTACGIDSQQKELIIIPEGIFFQYGVIRRGFGVPTSGEKYKLANVQYVDANH